MEFERDYLSEAIPRSRTAYAQYRSGWLGLDRRGGPDTGCLSMAKNVSLRALPTLRSALQPKEIAQGYGTGILSLQAIGDLLCVVYRREGAIRIDLRRGDKVYTGLLQSDAEEDERPRSVLLFHEYTDLTDPLCGSFVRRLLIFPDKLWVPFDPTADFTPAPLGGTVTTGVYHCSGNETGPCCFTVDGAEYFFTMPEVSPGTLLTFDSALQEIRLGETPLELEITSGVTPRDLTSLMTLTVRNNSVPDLDYAVVHQSRVFGAADGRVYASAYNSCTDWMLETVEESSTSSAWMSTTEGNVRADGKITGITVYDGHVILLKRDFMQQICGNRNPFRLQDVCASGALSQQALAVSGDALYAVTAQGVTCFTGGLPRIISDPLQIADWSGAQLAYYDRTLYCYVPEDHCVYTYETAKGAWGQLDLPEVCAMSASDRGLFFALRQGKILSLPGGTYAGFTLRTDLIAGGTHLRRLRRLELACTLVSGSLLVYADDDLLPCGVLQGKSGYQVLRCILPRHCGSAHWLTVRATGEASLHALTLWEEKEGDSLASI